MLFPVYIEVRGERKKKGKGERGGEDDNPRQLSSAYTRHLAQILARRDAMVVSRCTSIVFFRAVFYSWSFGARSTAGPRTERRSLGKVSDLNVFENANKVEK